MMHTGNINLIEINIIKIISLTLKTLIGNNLILLLLVFFFFF